MRSLIVFSTLILLVTACTGPTPTSSVTPSITPILSSKPLTQSLTPTPGPQSPTATAAPTSTIPSSATPDVRTELVDFTTQDNIKLAGTLFGEGDLAVILAHMGMPDVDQQSWHPFARLLGERGYTALAFDFRGRGKSEGTLEFNKLPYDLYAALQYLNDRGYSQIVCIGASMGGTACMRVALDRNLIGLGVIASVMSNGEPNEVRAEEVQQLTLPKLLVYGGNDFPGVVIDMKSIVELAPEPKLVQVYQTSAHGTNLFNTEYGNQLTELLISFLDSLRFNRPLPTP